MAESTDTLDLLRGDHQNVRELFQRLVFLYQETMSSGKQGIFFQLDSPEREDG